MTIVTLDEIDIKLKKSLYKEAFERSILNKSISIGPSKNQVLNHGREKLIEATFEGAIGQAFSLKETVQNILVSDLFKMSLKTSVNRAAFIASMNAVFKYYHQCEKTVHCKEGSPKKCGIEVLKRIDSSAKVLLIGFQSCLLEHLAQRQQVRVIDPNSDNVWEECYGISIEHPNSIHRALNWCDTVLVTGSTLINGSITTFINWPKPVTFFGVTISAPAKVLGLKSHCAYGY